MANPGEVNQEIGRAYQYAFIGALEATIPYFENKFDVHTEPEKTAFSTRTGQSYSFDFCGVYNHPWVRTEVFGECKGYSKAGGLLQDFRSFLAKAYVTSTDYQRHRKDYFWFVTNVPFACTEGSGVRNYAFVLATLTDKRNAEVQEILGGGHVDESFVQTLVNRLGVFILTDSFLLNTDLSYKVISGESLWSILKKFHAGEAPYGFGSIATQIAQKNGLPSPDHVLSGQRIRLSWHGISRNVDDNIRTCF